MSEVVINVTKVERVVTINATPNVTQILVNTNSGGGIPEAPIDGNLYGRKNATWEQVTSGGGIPDAPNDANAYVRSALGWVVGYTKSAIDTLLGNKVDKVSGKGLSQEDYTTAEKSKLASITEIFTTALKTTYDNAVTWITTNGSNVLNHIASTSNPHNVTKSQVGLSNVVNADTTTTANITDSTNKRFVTDANLVVIGNTSGTNSGDNATNTTSNSYADAKVVAELASFKTANFLDFTSSGQTQLDGKQNTLGFISYASATTTVGWSSFYQKTLRYIDFNTHCLYFYHLEGPGNSINSSFTIHFTATENSASMHIPMNNGSYLNNPGRGSIENGSNVVNLYATMPGSTWSGGASTKIASGIIIIKK